MNKACSFIEAGFVFFQAFFTKNASYLFSLFAFTRFKDKLLITAPLCLYVLSKLRISVSGFMPLTANQAALLPARDK